MKSQLRPKQYVTTGGTANYAGDSKSNKCHQEERGPHGLTNCSFSVAIQLDLGDLLGRADSYLTEYVGQEGGLL